MIFANKKTTGAKFLIINPMYCGVILWHKT